MALFDLFKKKEDKKHKRTPKVPKTVQESIPFLTVFGDGVMETAEDLYTRMYMLEDINFKIAPDTEKAAIFRTYEDFLNGFPAGASFQVIIHNHSADKKNAFEDIRYKPQRDSMNKYRQEINHHLLDSFVKGKKNLSQDKYLVVGVSDAHIGSAIKNLDSIEKEAEKGIRRITKEAGMRKLGIEERLRILFDIYNQDGSVVFSNDIDEQGKPSFSFEKLAEKSTTTKNVEKDVVAPSGMEFGPGYFKLGETYGRAFFLDSNLPNELRLDFMSDLSDCPVNMLISIHYDTVEMNRGVKMVKEHLLAVNRQVADSQDKANKGNYSFDLISPSLQAAQKKSMELMDDVVGNDQKLFYGTFTVCIFADSKEELEISTKQVQGIVSKYVCQLRRLDYQQEQGLNESLPLCLQNLYVKRLYTSISASAFIPYTTLEFHHKEGLFYGINKLSNNMILYDRTTAQYYNGLIIGQPGSGKSFMAKYEMVSSLLRESNTQVFVVDPEGEYVDLAEALDGEVINLSPGSKTYVNPLDMDIEYDGESNPIGMKTQYIISMIEIMLGEDRGISPEARTVITRCCNTIYRPYLAHINKLREAGKDITCDKEAMPTLNTLYNELKRQEEPEARTMAKILETYAVGSFATFAHRSNVESNKKLVVYNIKNLGSGMKDLGLHVCINDVWNKMIDNKKRDMWTRFYIDELHILLQSESATRYLAQIWRRARKWMGIPTGITQNTDDFMRNDETQKLITNTSFVIMMSLSGPDQANLSDLLNIPDSQMEYVTNADRGSGLIYTGKTTVPFSNEFPEDTELYELLSTSEKKK